MIARLKAYIIGWFRSSQSQPSGTPKSVAPEVLTRLEQAKADFEAAVRLWPRNRAAINRAWRPLRDAKSAQLSAEMGR